MIGFATEKTKGPRTNLRHFCMQNICAAGGLGIKSGEAVFSSFFVTTPTLYWHCFVITASHAATFNMSQRKEEKAPSRRFFRRSKRSDADSQIDASKSGSSDGRDSRGGSQKGKAVAMVEEITVVAVRSIPLALSDGSFLADMTNLSTGSTVLAQHEAKCVDEHGGCLPVQILGSCIPGNPQR